MLFHCMELVMSTKALRITVALPFAALASLFDWLRGGMQDCATRLARAKKPAEVAKPRVQDLPDWCAEA
jgi:hypothetical protein